MFPCGVLILSQAGSQNSSDFGRSIDRVKLHRLHYAVIPRVISFLLVLLLAIKGKYSKISSANAVNTYICQPDSNQHSLVSLTFCGIIVHEFHIIL